MPYTQTRQGKYSFSLLSLLLAAGVSTAAPPFFLPPEDTGPHIILPEYSLYKKDTAVNGLPGAGVLHVTNGGKLTITVPSSAAGKYRVRFYSDENIFLFEVRQIRDTMLIIEKANFLRAGWFRYELYRDSQLIEKSRFFINRD